MSLSSLIGQASRGADLYFVFRFLRLLTMKYESTDAYKFGIIDKKGKALKKSGDLKSTKEKASYTMMHRMVFKIRRLMEKVPGGRFVNYAAALFLLKEQNNTRVWTDDVYMKTQLLEFLETDWEADAKFLKEEVDNMDKKSFKSFLSEKTNIKESQELQAMMALDDAGIEAVISRKGKIVINKKDLKKAEAALKKSFRKGGAPELQTEGIDIEKASMKDVIADFKSSDAPQFKGKSDKKKKEMAIAAKLSKEEFDLEESTKEYAKSLEKIANDRTLKTLTKSERENLKKIADLLSKEEFEIDEASKLPPHLAKFFDDKGNLKPEVAARIAKGKEKLNIKDVTPKGYGPKEEFEITESGHTDVASAKNQVKVAKSALQKMEIELSKLPDEGSLPSWWTNKVAIAVDKLDGMADYLGTQVSEAFKSHKMYDPKTGKAYDADTEEDHLRYKKIGYTHEKPQVEALEKEGAAEFMAAASAAKKEGKKKFKFGGKEYPVTIKVDIPLANEEIANSVGGGGIAGLDTGLTAKKKRDDTDKAKKLRKQYLKGAGLTEEQSITTFAGKDVFIVDSDTFHNCRLGKKKYGRYETYVGDGEVGQTIREYGLKYPRRPIILQNGDSGPMLYLQKDGKWQKKNIVMNLKNFYPLCFLWQKQLKSQTQMEIFNWRDGLNFIEPLKKLGPAIDNIEDIIPEIADLDADEWNELITFVSENWDLETED